jgi:hypothetical protein
MVITLSLEDSVNYLDGSWLAYRIEEDTLERWIRARGTEPTAVVLIDGTVAFYIMKPGVVL